MDIICNLLWLYLIAIFVRIVLSYFPMQPDGFGAQISSILYSITEPVLGPIRRMMPGVGFGGMSLDLSPIVVIFAIQLFLMPIFCS